MPALHVRDLDEAVIDALKARAKKHRRSLQGEAKLILEHAALEGAPAPGRRKLELVTVRVGAKTSFSRKDIYDDRDER